MNYFTLFELPESIDIDINKLTERFQTLQRQSHPDKFATRPEREQLEALQLAATVNQGYQALRHPVRRAEYLLLLQGIDLNNEQHTLQDKAFLIEQMELRETLENIEQQRDMAALSHFLHQLLQQEQTLTELARQQLIDNAWATAADSVRKLRFLTRLRESAEHLEEQLLDF